MSAPGDTPIPPRTPGLAPEVAAETPAEEAGDRAVRRGADRLCVMASAFRARGAETEAEALEEGAAMLRAFALDIERGQG